jgi:hypothetical protein
MLDDDLAKITNEPDAEAQVYSSKSCALMKMVVASAAEAELGALFTYGTFSERSGI